MTVDLHRAAAASEAALAPYHILDTAPEIAFDDLARLAADLCGAPVALINLFATGRQCFKAQVGFDGPEPPIDDSLCRHAIDSDGLLVIPDLLADGRTCGDAVVAAAPHARFYAGAPLRSAEGVFLGTLCVIDFAPRPTGLTDAQERGLATLSDQVMATMELRRLLREGARENRNLAQSEAYWRSLFQASSEGFIIGEVVRDAAGHAIDWRYVDVNEAWAGKLGIPRDDALGRTVTAVVPGIERRWVDDLIAVAETGRPHSFVEQVGVLARWYDGRAFSLGGDRFAVLFVEATERVAATRRADALVRIVDRLRDLHRMEDMTDAVARIVGETLGASRSGFGRLDARREQIEMQPEWLAPGMTSIAGTHRFADYGDLLNELLAGEPLVIDDVTVDPRSAAQPMQALNIGSLINMPVRERDRTVALFFVQQDRPRQWTAAELTFLRDVADRVELEVNRLEMEARRIIQTQELSHRVKNTLAMVQAIASQTLKEVENREAVATFDERLKTLATAHDVLLGSEWEAAPLLTTIRSVVESAGQAERVSLAGPPIDLSPRGVLSTSLLVHELITNAVKYGALSVSEGSVAVQWSIDPRDGRPELCLEWTESGGPPAAPPTRRGFGSRLINMGLVGTGGVILDYATHGLRATMCAAVEDLTKI